MVPFGNWLAYALAALVIILIPGPSVLFVIGRSLAFGRRGGLLSVLGNALGALPQVVAVAVGVGVIVAQSIVAFTIVKLVGAAYLVYLGVQAIRHRNVVAGEQAGTTVRSSWRLVAEGFVVGLTNPKTIVFFVAVLPQFVDYSAGSVPLQMLLLGLTSIMIGLVCDSGWALSAGFARNWFAKSPKRMSRMRGTGGVMMIGLGGTMALTGNK
ncbi:LysE family translocator [Herbiconiux ginsengi]|uniref:Threonine/homoserine/homoserine lactone efflux protein n=1 Tax=Herbiconiux ginsengi TaxID=381665 RepID=A0A1H3S8V0_9MICO|nr:LysE family translocator [Herbiconiux ginsengi]SDZ34476.1 Threonine/homoserine/homoserine lactone efflux protein [Herbiconiux ginsengi]